MTENVTLPQTELRICQPHLRVHNHIIRSAERFTQFVRRQMNSLLSMICPEADSVQYLVEEAQERATKPWFNRMPGDRED